MQAENKIATLRVLLNLLKILRTKFIAGPHLLKSKLLLRIYKMDLTSDLFGTQFLLCGWRFFRDFPLHMQDAQPRAILLHPYI